MSGRCSAITGVILVAGALLLGVPSVASPAGAGVRAKTHRVSLGAHGRQAVGASGEPAVSAHGRFVGFESSASNLVQRHERQLRRLRPRSQDRKDQAVER